MFSLQVVESEEEAAGPSALPEDLSTHTSPPSPPRTSTRVRETSPAARKRKPTQPLTTYQQSIVSALERETDEDEHFLLSLVPSFRRLDIQKKALVRMRFQQVLYNAEFGEGEI